MDTYNSCFSFSLNSFLKIVLMIPYLFPSDLAVTDFTVRAGFFIVLLLLRDYMYSSLFFPQC